MNWFDWAKEHLAKWKAAQTAASKMFTPRAQQAFWLARGEAERLNHNYVGTEHVLVGLIELGQGVAVKVLNKLGLNLETVRLEIEKLTPCGSDPKMFGNIPYTPRMKRVLTRAKEDAKVLNQTYIGIEHILLGLLAEVDGVAARVFQKKTLILNRCAKKF